MLTAPSEPIAQLVAESGAPDLATSVADDHEWLTADEMASWLRLNRKTVYECAARKLIPCERFKRTLRFHRPTVIAWLARPPSVPVLPAPRRARRNPR
jgi:excisionase family DNA binding protein